VAWSAGTRDCSATSDGAAGTTEDGGGGGGHFGPKGSLAAFIPGGPSIDGLCRNPLLKAHFDGQRNPLLPGLAKKIRKFGRAAL
jgi:hypothetical protein